MLYRVVQNLWEEPEGYGKVRMPPAPNTVEAPEFEPVEPVERPPAKPPADEQLQFDPTIDETKSEKPKFEPVVEETDEKPSKVDKEAQGIDKEDEVKIPVLKEQGEDESESDAHKDTTEKSGSGKATDRTEDTDETSDSKSPAKEKVSDEDPPEVPEVHWKDPPKNHPSEFDEDDVPKKHWTKPKENFPVPPGSVAPLPTGKPKKIPKIQFDFGTESEQARSIRLKRQRRVKAELERAWSGYRNGAWMHDELSPVSNMYRDPFCGWAATLVDSLDTLWIAGMKKEFDEAAKAVKDIDFTWAPRSDIPVFETTIRYLGGLLAAYDVSGGDEGDYPILLEKAVELGEILMGIFDTPNRMPILYYKWRPPYSSQPHRATTVGIAELATLSMEFTRLAQLTGKNKYYDAIDRITNGLVDMQKAGTVVPGLFPEKIDASGCNKTAATMRETLSKGAQSQMDSEELLEDPVGYKDEEDDSEKLVIDESAPPPMGQKGQKDSPDERLGRRDLPPTRTSPEDDDLEVKDRPERVDILQDFRKAPFAADGSTTEWDCPAQPLVPAGYGQSVFHMGGAQDSAYEYFQKVCCDPFYLRALTDKRQQFLLLGGLEPKYKKLHVDAIDAVYDWLMFRPMIKDEGWDILFPAKISTAGDPENDMIATFEVAHLTCFIGGMFGMGGKIFDRPKDVETAKKLTDGCVWAYQSTASGIMPEYAYIMSCPTLDKCEFNETLWWEYLDPSKDWREREVVLWEEKQAEKKLGKKSSKKDDAALDNLKRDPDAKVEDSDEDDVEPQATPRGTLHKRDALAAPGGTKEDGEDEAGSELPDSLKEKLDLNYDEPKSKKATSTDEEDAAEMPVLQHLIEEDGAVSRDPPSIPNTMPGTPTSSWSDEKPQGHKEYIHDLLQDENIPPGFVSMISRHYILR